jgi:hypothetical protein
MKIQKALRLVQVGALALLLTISPRAKAEVGTAFCAGMLASSGLVAIAGAISKKPIVHFGAGAVIGLMLIPCFVSQTEAAEALRDPQTAAASNPRFKTLSEALGITGASDVYTSIAEGKSPPEVVKQIETILALGPMS